MKQIMIATLTLGVILVAGCSVSKDGASMSETKWIDNNCSGNGYIVNKEWCAGDFGASMGPYTGR